MLVISAIDWTAVGIVGTLVVSLLGSLFGLYQGRKADKSATTTETIELGVKHLIDQYQERQKELKDDVDLCNKRCQDLQKQTDALKAELSKANTHIRNLESKIVRLKIIAGEPINET